ncbi:MAG: cupin domain-containing protein [Hyphomicrobiales bacterium]
MKAFIVRPGEGRSIVVGSAGVGVTIKASQDETGGVCTVWEGRVPPGQVGAGPHLHRRQDELFYVLEGEISLRIGEETRTAPSGTFAFVPRGTVHGFHNRSDRPAALLVQHTPGGFERFLDEMQEWAARGGSAEERAEIAARHDMFPAPPSETAAADSG